MKIISRGIIHRPIASLVFVTLFFKGISTTPQLTFPENNPDARSSNHNNNDAIFFPRVNKPPDVPCSTYEGKQGSCRLLVQCATFYAEIAQLSRSPCSITEKQQGVCCPPTKRPTQDPSNVVMKPNKPIVFGPDMKTNEINHACEESIWKIKERMNFESDLVNRNIVAEKGSPVFFHARLFETTEDILKKAQDATLTLQATQELVKQFSLTKEQAEHALPKFGVENTIIAETCPLEPRCPETKYRTIDGSCNNVVHKDWGKAGTAYERFLSPEYSDGVSAPRVSVNGGALPSARSISSFVTVDRDNVYTNFTLLIMQWGQFLDHDITHTPISKGPNKADISCCTRGTIRQNNDLHPECMPIQIPRDDQFYGQFNQGCMEFVRSMPAIRPKCKFGPREQMNQITAFIDASNVYGSNHETANKLRTFSGGLLKTTPNGRSHLLPGDLNSPGCRAETAQRQCFMAGDSRVNEQPDLAVMHTVWMRQHNKVAQELARINPGWRNNDEILYQEARRIVVAQLQHITYNEYLPIVLGRRFMEDYGLVPLKDGFANSYKPSINPSIHNAFSASAFRYGHTLISGHIEGYGKFGDQINLELSKTQFKPFELYDPGTFDALLRGLTKQKSQKFDHFFTKQITNKLFAQNFPFGMDLVALNIQRGRDHGLPIYNQWRTLCQLPMAHSWNDLFDVMDAEVVQKLTSLYDSVHDVDLFIGGISERPLPGSLLGPTFLCLVGDQFARLKLGDRFFYENGGLESSFSPAQLDEIRKTSLARIFCDNSDLTMMQPLAFVTGHLANKRAVCGSDILIPKVDLSKWTNEPVWN